MRNTIDQFINDAINLEKAQIRIELHVRKSARVVSINKPSIDTGAREFVAISRLNEDQLKTLFPLVTGAPSEPWDITYSGLDDACERITASLDLWVQQGMPAQQSAM